MSLRLLVVQIKQQVLHLDGKAVPIAKNIYNIIYNNVPLYCVDSVDGHMVTEPQLPFIGQHIVAGVFFFIIIKTK